MNTFARTTLSLSLALTAAGCTTIGLYQPLQNGVGYTETKLESNRFRVSYSGNAQTPRQTVENYLLYRAAEVTLANGDDYFVMADQSTDKNTRYTQTISGFGGFGRYSWSPFFDLGVGVSNSTPSSEYLAQASIVTYAGKKPKKDTAAFDAREVKANLEALIQRPRQK